jgi:hypothetical protein
MPEFNRFDICEAHLTMEWDWNRGGILPERKSNRRRNMSTDFQLHRMKFRPGAGFNGYSSLSENGREIYRDLCKRYGLEFPADYATSDGTQCPA